MSASVKKTRPASWTKNGPDLYGLTQEECAVLLGITRERVGQIERSALKKIRDAIDPEFREMLDW